MGRAGTRRLVALGAGVVLAAAALLPAAATAGPATPPTYTNPVSRGVVDTFADPSIIRGHDGWWYAYATTDVVRQSLGDDTRHYLPVLRSRDLAHWSYVGDVFTAADRPSWHPSGSLLFAPDIRELNGRYYLYYAVAQPPRGPGKLFTVGVATAPTPTGPWTDSGGEVVRRGTCDTDADIDPAELTAADGIRYLYWGSFRHLCVAQLNADATRTVGDVTVVSTGFAEGSYVIRHGRFYYLMISEGTCCNGAFSSYQVKVGRSTSPRGPFLDREGIPLTAPHTKGTLAFAANGNAWVGPGHNSVATDLSGQQWFVYHALDRADPQLAPPLKAPRRPLMIDRLDWVDGWPVLRAGLGPSDGPQRAPVTSWPAGSTFDDADALAGWHGDGWRFASEPDAGGYVSHDATPGRPAYLVTRGTAPAAVRAEGDLRLGGDGAAGLVAAYRGPADHVAATLDAGAHAFRLAAYRDGRAVASGTAPLPASVDLGAWHDVAVEIRGSVVHAEVGDARQADPQASVDVTLPHGFRTAGAVGVVSAGGAVDADDVGAAPLYRPVTRLAPAPRPGAPLPAYGDEFADGITPGTPGDPQPWTWVRGPRGSESDGTFGWPTDGGTLAGRTDTAPVLVRPAPTGTYTVETKLTLDGDRTPPQQAGLVAYAGDDEYVALTHSFTTGTDPDRTEFLSEGTTPAGTLGSGVNYVGPPAPQMWLRLYHRLDPANGEHELTASTSRDGAHWIRGATWTMPADADVRIGLLAQGAQGATAAFDYFRVYGPGRPA